jgi:nucleotide-binding universal stress UspA family protein
MKRILVPVDFSLHTGISCRYALHLAKGDSAEIILFHSFFDQFYYSDGGLSTGFESGLMLTDEIILDFYKQKQLKLTELAGEMTAAMTKEEKEKIKVTCRMESGNPEVQIIHVIQQIQPQLIVMGSGGMGKKGLMSGSVARRIIDHTDIPVIAVPDIKILPEIKNVAYMTTFDPVDPEIISGIDRMLTAFRVNIFCLHLSKNDTAIASEKMNKLSLNKALEHLENRISYFVSTDLNEKSILQNFMKANHIGLIAFIPHKRNIFENLFYQGITRDDLFQTMIPIMAFRPFKQ